MSRWARTLVLVLLPVGLLVPLVFLGEAARHDDLFHWDTQTWLFLHRHEEAAHGSALDHAANFIVETGGNLATVVLWLSILGVLIALRRGRESLFFVVTGVLILTATPVLKEQFERSELNYSFPSGHAARSAALVTAAIVIAWPTRLRWPALVLGVPFAVTLGVALVYEDWHLPSDVIGGWCLGVLCAEAAWLVTRGLHRLRA
jgi:membrane-associated phospholipid phosphatase